MNLAICRIVDLPKGEYLLEEIVKEEKEWIAKSIILGKKLNNIKAIGKIEYEVEKNLPKYIRITGKAKILD